ncbi:hypothetical protein PBI_MRMAGOO_5 [Mycobacterium phage MrMagoo]|uniref:Uncharacterized protein n=1 Tax=Mycobacterium phage MrMagoo TaxID=1927020 RepID=A0A1L6BYD4_9CAUD|nr:hypothetical protein J4U04_gp005 [Mycobacterium phage MrMagoo]APQ42110.1 hypothetical protein PBI_MRMAGOO_5 [Mycobacterium phage MrMagoo]ARM70321.1 hypothetical protein SEA_GARDENSALSA_5 [Mycobacterium phage GardenSalsa]
MDPMIQYLGYAAAVSWVVSITGFILEATGVAPGAINMALGVGIVAAAVTVMFALFASTE